MAQDQKNPPERKIPSNNLLETNLNIRTDDFDVQELELNYFKNKSPGQNRTTAEFIKALAEDNNSHLLKLLNQCYRDKILFKEMDQADLAIIYKKGSTDKPEDYRPIALLNLSYKILAKMIQVRLCNGLDDHLDSQQYGFRKVKSISPPSFIYRRVLKIHEEAGLVMYTLLPDWEKAFDKVDQERMIIVLLIKPTKKE